MGPDLSKMLSDWPFEEGKLTCRMITGHDGEPRLQVRLDMGILQMHADGRPDGKRPFGFASLLDYYEYELEEDDPRDPSMEPADREGAGKRTLSAEDCRKLRDEAEQYYRRYVALMVLEDFERVARDTTRNLRLADFLRDHAESEDDRTSLDQYRPYILMLRTRALASMALQAEEPKAALLALDDGLEALRALFAETGKPQLFEKSTEVQALRTMREGLVPKLPVSQKSELRQRLARALAEENYELAAILRDELKQMKE